MDKELTHEVHYIHWEHWEMLSSTLLAPAAPAAPAALWLGKFPYSTKVTTHTGVSMMLIEYQYQPDVILSSHVDVSVHFFFFFFFFLFLTYLCVCWALDTVVEYTQLVRVKAIPGGIDHDSFICSCRLSWFLKFQASHVSGGEEISHLPWVPRVGRY